LDPLLPDERGRRVLEPGRFRITLGGSQPDARSVALLGRAPLAVELDVTGKRRELPY
jgi:beta-glucosidase